MNEPVTISKNATLGKSQDYNQLRKEGLEFIQKLSSNLWTDYNIHDPGITMLEVLCYAITELSYKTDFDIKDLLSNTEGEIFDNSNQFFTARQILTSSPVTILDFRKLLIDVEGVKNAWLEIVKKTKPTIWLDCKNSSLEYEDGIEFLPDGTPVTPAEKINLNGLYDIKLELDDDPEFGDLNKYHVEVPIKKAGEDFSFMVVLPAWDYYLSKNVFAEDIEKVKLSHLVEIDRTLYRARLTITKPGPNLISQVLIYSSKKSTTQRNLLIRQELLRTDKGSIADNYLNKLKKSLEIAVEVRDKLHENRSLCEDFDDFKNLEIEEVAVCADIEVEPAADNEKVLADILYQLEKHIAPGVNFYTYEELVDKGKRTEEIFEGPALNHGFIDNDELKQSDPKKVIYTSDLINIIMDIEGVVAVKKIVLASRHKAEILNDEVLWCLKIKEGLVPRLDMKRSKIVLYKENLPYYPNKAEVNEFLDELYALERKPKLAEDELYDLPIPEGTNRNPGNYFTIQNDFPLTYGIGERGIPGIVTDKRKAQAKQLKAYLLFFDQLLANYLAQLANVKALFSFSEKVDKTYFYKILYNLPNGFSFPAGSKGSSILYNNEQLPLIYNLLKDFTNKIDPVLHPSINLDDYSTFKSEWEDYKKKTGFENPHDTHFVKSLEQLVETQNLFYNRRNKFLDHIMARFAEQFTDYVLVMYDLDKKKAPAELIEDKTAFLKEYPEISSERGKAFNYRNDQEIWNTSNVSGLEKRVARLLGIENYNRRHLVCTNLNKHFSIYKDPATNKWHFEFKDNEGIVVFVSIGYSTKILCQEGIKTIKKSGKNEDNYELLLYSAYKYFFIIKDDDGNLIATSKIFSSIKTRLYILRLVISLFQGKCNIEGFHLVEHILLRPGQEGDKLMPVCVDEECKSCGGNKDPYSFRITMVVPYWPTRFNNMAFRRFFEKTVRLETPAHIHPKICWVDEEDMQKFETAYKEWLIEKSKKIIDSALLSEKMKALIEMMNVIRSVYPYATLHDCSDEGEEEDATKSHVILNNTILGTFNPVDDGNN